jgi:ribosomal protein S14
MLAFISQRVVWVLCLDNKTTSCSTTGNTPTLDAGFAHRREALREVAIQKMPGVDS